MPLAELDGLDITATYVYGHVDPHYPHTMPSFFERIPDGEYRYIEFLLGDVARLPAR